jgi:hypothetical protein
MMQDAVMLAYPQATAPLTHGTGGGSSGEQLFKYDKNYHGAFAISSTGASKFDEIASMQALEKELERQATHNGARIMGKSECCGKGDPEELLPAFSFWYSSDNAVGVVHATGRQIPGERYILRIDLEEFDPE